MKLHEYQAKELLRLYNVNTAEGVVIHKIEDVADAYKKLSSDIVAVKAQIHAGGRGKGTLFDREDSKHPEAKEVLKGGVKIAKNEKEALEYSEKILGAYLCTIQTLATGKKVSTVYLEAGANIKNEFYLSILLDRKLKKPVLVVSQEGGVNIEDVAETTPEKITKIPLEPSLGLQDWQAREIIFALGIPKEARKQALEFLKNLWTCYMKVDASLLEINPLALTENKAGKLEITALDCKMEIDDNALFRHDHRYDNIVQMRDKNEEDPLELKASEYNLNYIRLDGNVGCMVNGAGLAMGTMDIIKIAGAEPANFLDVGGGANVETVSNGFRIILEDKNVKAIYVNIFGGIVQCDRVAHGIVEAAKDIGINVPLIVRLQGTNAREAGEILANSGISLKVAKTLEEGAEMAANAVSAS